MCRFQQEENGSPCRLVYRPSLAPAPGYGTVPPETTDSPQTRKMPGSTSVAVLHLATTGAVLGAFSAQIATNVAVYPHQHGPLAAPPASTGQSTHHPGPQERNSSDQRTYTWGRCFTETQSKKVLWQALFSTNPRSIFDLIP
jgi:hypothetical protein